MYDLCMRSNSQPGIEPGPPASGAWGPSHWATREVPGRRCIFNLHVCLLERPRSHFLEEKGKVWILKSKKSMALRRLLVCSRPRTQVVPRCSQKIRDKLS